MRQLVAALALSAVSLFAGRTDADVFRWTLTVTSDRGETRSYLTNQNAGGSIRLGGFVCEYDAPDTSRSDRGTVIETRGLWCTHTDSGVQARTATSCGATSSLVPLKMFAPGEAPWMVVLGCR